MRSLVAACIGLFLPLAVAMPASADSLWNHNGSVMRLVAEGNNRIFYYEAPRPAMAERGVRQGTLFFNGQRVGNRYAGTARAFSRECSAPMEYRMSGTVVSETKIVLAGRRPVFRNCRATSTLKYEELVLTYLSTIQAPMVAVQEDNTQATRELSGVVQDNTAVVAQNSQEVSQNTAATREVVSAVNEAAQMSSEAAAQMNRRIGDLSAQIATLSKVLEQQREEEAKAPDPDGKLTVEQAIAAIESRLGRLRAELNEKDKTFSRYLTSVQPNDRDLYLTARKASETYPKVPFYIPGTSETGEFWVEPKVTDTGDLVFNFRLIDPTAENETTRELVVMNLDQLKQTQAALFKLRKNSQTAHDNKIRENYAKRVVCFPSDQCPAEREKGQRGKTSTEIVFMIYEDGSTGGRLQLNKGAYQEGVNFSIDSALLLQAYLAYVMKEAKLEFESGVRTQKQLDQMFQ